MNPVPMNRPAFVLLAIALAACAPAGGGTPPAGSGTTVAADTTVQWCADPTRQSELCSMIPHEVIVSLPMGYRGLLPEVQPHFDVFSWQSFVALNWPADTTGTPIGTSIGENPGAPRVWETYRDAADVFWGGGGAGRCNAGDGRVLMQMAKNGHVVDPDGSFDEAVGGPLVDRNLNFVVFEKKMNPDEVDYVVGNSLYLPASQATIDTIDFPAGYYADPEARTGGQVGAIELKAAWRILQPEQGDDPTRFYSRAAVIYVPAAHSETQSDLCLNATVGLVGLHVIHKTQDFPQWIWSTFEHVDNAPTCPAGTVGCGQDGRRYSFYNAACPGCTANAPLTPPADSVFKWAATAPYAARYAVAGGYGNQIVRTQQVYAPTEAVNAVWRARLAGTVWANYTLIGSQWHSGGDSPGTAENAPPILGNSTLESYIPDTSDCIGCHSFARTAAAADGSRRFADFSFLLEMAGKAPTMHGAVPGGVARP
jgi:hypothetical protein